MNSVQINLSINIQNCNYISFHKLCSIIFSYAVNALPINQISTLKDLCVIFLPNLFINNRIGYICNKVHEILSLLIIILLTLINLFCCSVQNTL